MNKDQRKLVKRWIGVARFIYNQTIEYLNQPDTKASWKSIKTGILHSLPKWCDEAPYQIKSIAIRDACQAVSTNKKKAKKTGKPFKMRFRSLKNPKQSCYIPKSAIKEKGIYHTLLGEIHLKESLPELIRDSRLVVDSRQRYYIVIPTDRPITRTENQGRVVALDVGIRNFVTFFSEDSCGHLGQQTIGRIQRLCAHLDDLISKIALCTKASRRYRLRKAAARMRLKIRDIIDELHHQVANYLVKNFDVILLPTFEVSNMVLRGKRRIGRKSVRNMLTLSHYRFAEFLKFKAFQYGKQVIRVSEAWTSKTVSWSGNIQPKLGGAKEIKESGITMDRDLNGARGIFLRALGDTPFLQQHVAV